MDGTYFSFSSTDTLDQRTFRLMQSITLIHLCYLYHSPTNMRKGLDNLFGLFGNELGKDPLKGELFVFFSRNHNQKKVERGTYELPQGKEIHHNISSEKLNLILQGSSLKSVQHRRRYQHAEKIFL